MRLKKLIVHGFKSFADRTEFSFDTPITAIVGPNGCGKSNVVDAVKWVLGEQSAKSLRGDAMMDVIFNGSAVRKSSGMAEVVLVFDNPKRDDGTRLLNLDVDEVLVGRRLFRDGTSEYQLNNQASRLKDIRELFFDTGIGVDAYSMIEQGRVAVLLESNPIERRIIFEEAAGISKFKAKKKEAQRKLERVDQNLLRVTDIVDEVDKRLRSVRIQAGRARTYQEHSRRLRELRLTYALQEYHTLHRQLDEHQSKEGKANLELERITTELSEKQLALSALKREFDSASQQKQRGEYELVQMRAAIQSAQQRQEYARQQLEQIADQLAQFEEDRASLSRKSDEAAAALGTEEESLKRLTEVLSEHRRQIEQRQQAFHDTQLQLNQSNREIEQHKTSILDLMRRSAAVNNRLGAIEIERRNIAAQQQRLASRRQVVLSEIETLEAGRKELDETLAAVVAEIGGLQSQLEESVQQASVLDKQITMMTERLGAAREHRSALLSRQRLLQDLEANREGVSEGVKAVLRQRNEKFPFIRGLVADVLRADVEHAQVIEAALDGRDQMLVADNHEAVISATAAMDELEGRVNILCLDRLAAGSGDAALEPGAEEDCSFAAVAIDGCEAAIAHEHVIIADIDGAHVLATDAWDAWEQNAEVIGGQEISPAPIDRVLAVDQFVFGAQKASAGYDWNRHPQSIRIASDLVIVDPKDAVVAEHLLGRTAVVDTLADAQALHRHGPAGWRYVTKDAAVIEADGTIRVGPLTAAMGLISRRSELEALKAQIAEVDRRVAHLAAQVTQGNTQAKTLQEQQNTLRNAIYHANTKKVQTSSRIAQNTDKQSSFRRELPVLERELQNYLEQTGRLKMEEITLMEKREGIESEQASRQKQVEELSTKQAEGAENLKACGEMLTTLRVQLGQVQEKQIASQQAVQRLKAAKAELAEQIERIARSAEQVAARRASVESELESAHEAELQQSHKHQVLAKRIEELAAHVSDLQGKLAAMSEEVGAATSAHQQVEQTLHQLALQIGEVRVRIEGLAQRTIEELQLDLPARYAELDQQGEYQPADMDWTAVADEIRQLRDKIQRLGNVNLDAIGEQDELEKRQEFLATQVGDLTTSKKQLEELIETINKESSTRFEQTFNTVREHFQGMFRKLFGGGKADIFLETSVQDTTDQQPVIGPDGQTILPVVRKTIDPLEAGIEIIARPPGKQPVSISQLSGGEKTMTCVALLMSIFKSKPSPFCILDEVDAALDEANNQRFNLIVQEFLDQSQFIIITHSKRTMQIADVLYGVTMQEQGVSKRVAVRFDQVDNEGRIKDAEHAAA